MSPHCEFWAFTTTLAALVAIFFSESLFLGKVLSPADVLLVTKGFASDPSTDYEPANRLLIDPVLQFQPWLEFNRTMLRRGRLPLWNDLAGCGTPHLANGQSAVFDPFHWIAYLGRLPDAYAWMAAARLWTAGVGMFLLARRWGLGVWGRWFAGLTFPFCGFLIVWLLYPVTNAAIWMPWLLLASDVSLSRTSGRTVALVGLATGLVLLGGHIQTSAHVLIAAGLYTVWRTVRRVNSHRALAGWAAGVALGIGLASIEIVPLGFYLARSPVWTDRESSRPGALEVPTPRLLDAARTALPYAYGSQRRGHPNLARALGAQNLNEAAGGFAGLATLIWLAPSAWSFRRSRPLVGFLAILTVIGACGAFDIPPVANVLRALPVLDVIDHRRLTLWVAFGLALLGGIGLDGLIAPARGWIATWLVGSGLLVVAAVVVGRAGPYIEARAFSHYEHEAANTLGADPMLYHQRALRQAAYTLRFIPRYAVFATAHLTLLAGLAVLLRRGRIRLASARTAILIIVLADLFAFGFGLNPALARSDDRPEPALITYLHREAPPPARILALGSELPPNTLMRYGLADVRNYDSIESAGTLAYFEPLYEPGRSRTSRREITWPGVARAELQLRAAGVTAVVGPTPPPDGLFDRVDHVGAVWVGRFDGSRLLRIESDHGQARVWLTDRAVNPLQIPIAYIPGWRATIDDRPAPVGPDASGAFLAVKIPPGARQVALRYDPPELRVAATLSLLSISLIGLLAARGRGRSSERKTLGGAWMPRTCRVRIGTDISDRSPAPVPYRG